MKPARIYLVAGLAVGIAFGCSNDDGSSPSAVVFSDLVGSWEATEFSFRSQANPGLSLDLIDLGTEFAFSVAPNGDYTIVVRAQGQVSEVGKGKVTVSGGTVLVEDEQNVDPISFAASRSGSTLTMRSEFAEFDFDSDGQDDPAIVTLVLRPLSGTTPADLAGTWDAIEFRYVSVPSQTDTVDVLAAGGGVVLTVTADGRYLITLSPPGEPAQMDIGVLLVDGTELILIEDSSPGDPRAPLSFGLSGETLSLGGSDEFDFDDDGFDDPARLEVVFQRR